MRKFARYSIRHQKLGVSSIQDCLTASLSFAVWNLDLVLFGYVRRDWIRSISESPDHGCFLTIGLSHSLLDISNAETLDNWVMNDFRAYLYRFVRQTQLLLICSFASGSRFRTSTVPEIPNTHWLSPDRNSRLRMASTCIKSWMISSLRRTIYGPNRHRFSLIWLTTSYWIYPKGSLAHSAAEEINISAFN